MMAANPALLSAPAFWSLSLVAVARL